MSKQRSCGLLRGIGRRHVGAGKRDSHMRDFAKSKNQYKYIFQNPQWQYGFFPLIQEFWAERPHGMPFTWSTVDINTDLGTFSEDTYPPALPGETLEEYCRRVPNIWSPCSKASDTVDVAVFIAIEFAQDELLEDHKFTERPMLKITPVDSDFRLEQDWLDLQERGIKQPPLVNGKKPLYPVFTKDEVQAAIEIIEEAALRIGTNYWLKSKNWPDFWHEFTGQNKVPQGELMDKLQAMFFQEPHSFEIPDELQHPDKKVTECTNTISPPNRWADKQEDLLRDEEDFKYQLDRDYYHHYRERMDHHVDKSTEFGETKIREPIMGLPPVRPRTEYT